MTTFDFAEAILGYKGLGKLTIASQKSILTTCDHLYGHGRAPMRKPVFLHLGPELFHGFIFVFWDDFSRLPVPDTASGPDFRHECITPDKRGEQQHLLHFFWVNQGRHECSESTHGNSHQCHSLAFFSRRLDDLLLQALRHEASCIITKMQIRYDDLSLRVMPLDQIDETMSRKLLGMAVAAWQ